LADVIGLIGAKRFAHGGPVLAQDFSGERKESRSQALGRAVTDLAEGILTPSGIRNGRNLVIYPGSLMSESKIEVLGQDKLPN
jgi:hypothetical protein